MGASWSPRWSETARPNPELREAAITFERDVIAAGRQPDGTRWRPNWYSDARRGMEHVVGAIEEQGWTPAQIPRNFLADVWLARAGRPTSRLEAIGVRRRLDFAAAFLDWLRAQGWAVGEFDPYALNVKAFAHRPPTKAAVIDASDDAAPPPQAARPRLRVVAAEIHATPPPDEAPPPTARPPDPTAGFDAGFDALADAVVNGPEVSPRVQPKPSAKPAKKAPAKAAVAPKSPKESPMPPRQSTNPLASKMPSGYVLQVWRERPGRDPLWVGEWAAEQVNTATSIPAFLRGTALHALPVSQRADCGAEVRLVVYHLHPSGAAENTEAHSISTPAEWSAPAPVAFAPTTAPSPAPNPNEPLLERLLREQQAENRRLAEQVAELQRAAFRPPPMMPAPVYPQSFQPPTARPAYEPEPEQPAAPSIVEQFAGVALDAARAQLTGRPPAPPVSAEAPRAALSPFDDLERTVSIVDRLRGDGARRNVTDPELRRELDEIRRTLADLVPKTVAAAPLDPMDAVIANFQKAEALGKMLGVDLRPRKTDAGPENLSTKIGDALLELVRKGPDLIDRIAVVQRQNAGIFETPGAAATPEQQQAAEQKRQAFEAQIRAKLPAGLQSALDALCGAKTPEAVKTGLEALVSGLDAASTGEHAAAFTDVKNGLVQILEAREAVMTHKPVDAQARLVKINQAMYAMLERTLMRIGYRTRITKEQLVFVIRSWWALMDTERAEKEARDAARAAESEREQQAMIARLREEEARRAAAVAAVTALPATPGAAPGAEVMPLRSPGEPASAALSGFEPPGTQSAPPPAAEPAELTPERRAEILRSVNPFQRA